MIKSDFIKKLDEQIKYIEQVLLFYLPKEEGYQKTIMEAMGYSVSAGGKRIRPILMWETYQLFGGSNKKVIEPFMAAIEMIHTYSLVHDDLPAMDDDEYRRGKKTTHVAFGEAIGILAGDALLNYAFETACTSFDSGENPIKISKALKILARKPGIYGMIGGQVIDVEAVNQPVTKDKLETIYRLKTSALMEAAMMIGAVLADASDDEVKSMETAAEKVGIAFQIQDDILDITSTSEILGKPILSDEKNNKTTYITLEGLDKAKEEVSAYSEIAIDKLRKTGRKNEFLETLIIELIKREK